MKSSLIGIGAVALVVTLFGAIAKPELACAQATAGNVVGGGNWHPIRPTQERKGSDAGRIDVLAFDPSNASTIYAGAPSGGLWRSLDNGKTWKSLTDALQNMSVTDIAIDPLAPQTIYVLTGNGDDASRNWPSGDTPFSTGVLKSVDGGETWQTTRLAWTTQQFVIGHRLAMHPATPQIMLAATSKGLLRTTDGFATWTTAKTTAGVELNGLNDPFFDVLFNPADPSVVYAASQTNVYRSLDAGETWTQLGGGLPAVTTANNNRIRLAVSPAGPNTLYVLYGAPDGFSIGLWRSDDRGETFTLQSRSASRPTNTDKTPPFDLAKPNILYQFNQFGGQTGYTLAMTVSPTDINRVHVGALDTWRSTDGGKTWTQTSDWTAAMGALNYVHADIHYLAYRGETFFAASDGGVYQSDDDGSSWHARNNITLGGGITMIWSICSTPQDANLLYYGAQDIGTWKLELNGTLTKVWGGDGTICQINPKDSNTVYWSYPGGELFRSDDGGSHYNFIQPAAAGAGAWLMPFVLDVTNPDTIYACYTDIWVSADRGAKWRNLSNGGIGVSNQCAQIAQAPSEPSTIYTAKNPGLPGEGYSKFWFAPGGGNLPPFLGGGGVFRSTDGGSSWQVVTGTLPVADALIGGLAVSPTDARRVWVTFLGYQKTVKVSTTIDGGEHWSDISTGLPNVTVFVVVARNNPTHGIFVGTDHGVFYRDDSADAWIPFSNGMPAVIVMSLSLDEAHHRLIAGTYGRGVWITDIPAQ